MNKHIATVVVGVVVGIAIGTASVVSYNHYKSWADAQAAKATAASQAEAKANTLEQAIFNRNLHDLEAQCGQLHTAYNSLPAAAKAKAIAPSCSPSLVQ